MYNLGDAKGPRVLVVGDDPALRELLTIAGYDTHEARDGQEALDRIGDLRPAAMVLDTNMPRVDGFAVLETLQAAASSRTSASWS